ncbi:hypothetical protein ACRRTK_003478 [Alexandromys fortis]
MQDFILCISEGYDSVHGLPLPDLYNGNMVTPWNGHPSKTTEESAEITLDHAKLSTLPH